MIGILPGAGATTGALFGYTFGQRLVPEKIRKQFGTGVPEGVAAPESANNAACSGAFVPLLTLGIPGSATTAVILAAFILHGIRPGPNLIATQGPLVYTIFAALLMANVAMLLANQGFVSIFTKVRHLPRPILFMLIMAFSIIGAYATRNIMVDLWLMLAFGLIGFVFERYNYAIAPLIIGLVLGPLAEPSLRRSIIKSSGDYFVFFQRPLSAVLLVAAIMVFFIPLLQDLDVYQQIKQKIAGTDTEVER
jgi:putative tricarboxylic transport membrane protein